jgi:hypothetical protein
MVRVDVGVRVGVFVCVAVAVGSGVGNAEPVISSPRAASAASD